MSLIDPKTMRQLDALNYYTATRKYDLSFPRLTEDLEAAVAHGSTMVRVGTAIFGARDYS